MTYITHKKKVDYESVMTSGNRNETTIKRLQIEK